MKMNPWLKLALEMGPLIIFFLANNARGIFVGTSAFMAATVIAMTAAYVIARTIPIMPLVTAVFVLVFGGLTVVLENDIFIKIKPTIVNLLFAVILLVGLMTGRLFIKVVLEAAFHLTERGWIILTRAWIGFFATLAVVNEVVWRNFSTDTWVSFKVFGIMPFTVAFSLAMVPIVLRHTIQPDENGGDKPTVDSP